MQRLIFRQHTARFALLPLGCGLLLASLLAQEGNVLQADKLDTKEESRLREYQYGKKSIESDNPQEKAEIKQLLEKASKYHAYRLTWPRYQGEAVLDDTSKGDTKTMHMLVQETCQLVVVYDPTRKPVDPAQFSRQLEFSREFGRLLAGDLRKVLKNDKPITRINGARILAHLGRAGIEEAVDPLVEILQDPNENDAVKLYACRGLKDFLAVKQPDRKREQAVIQALVELVKQRAATGTGVVEEDDAIRYVRREALRALAESRYPNAAASGKAEDATAYWLLRVARRDRLQPEPSLAEQLEAAIGVCKLLPKLSKDYNLEAAAHHVGRFIVDFAGQSSNRAPGVPWKVYAARLSAALDELQARAAGLPAEKKIAQMVPLAKAALEPLEKGGNANPAALERWLDANPPANQVVFTGIPDSVVRSPDAGGN
ncbi:MAG: hypothetical protein NZ700_15975 [Gemmataceae bacterium]|nr:hypothetical protein [Gemmataceae bacterium]MDW8264625.1 HEAT repeat domain-containing protein [Gemmataceae bacterium]